MDPRPSAGAHQVVRTERSRLAAKRVRLWLFGTLVAGLLLGSCLQRLGAQSGGSTDSSARADGAALASVDWIPPAFAQANSSGATLADVAEKTTPGVVNISATKIREPAEASPFSNPLSNDPFFRFFGPSQEAPRERREHGLGSGVIVSKDGLVLTNHHVVAKAEDIVVLTSENREFEASVVGTDEKSDLALLRLKGDLSGLKPLEFGDSAKLRLGDLVLAIGNPFGLGQTVTMGIVSAKGRANMGIVDYEDFIQTDAAINPGNSGGALVSMEGRLVGINTAILSKSGGNQGIGFTIPSNMVRPIMDSLLKHGKVVRGRLGIGIQNINQDLARALKLPKAEGVLVSEVQADSPAAKAGFKRGDVVLSIDGTPTNTASQLRNLVAASGAGKTVEARLRRDGQEKVLKVTLTELPADDRKDPKAQPAQKRSPSGLELDVLSDVNRNRYRIPKQVTEGLVVTDVDEDSSAGKAGIRAGDVIVQANGKPLSNASDFERALAASDGTLLVLVSRNGSSQFVALRKK